jgi:glycosyltransferase involved in cell wall biosynthesis
MALTVGIDAWNLPHDRRGIGRYTRAVLECWSSWDRAVVEPVLIVPERLAWLAAPRYRTAARLPRVRVASRSAVAASRIDAVWYPWNGMSWQSPVVNVATLHDASVFLVPASPGTTSEKEQLPFRLAAQRAQRIITDSQFAKQDLVRWLALDPDAVDVISLGIDPAFARAGAQAQAQAGAARTYVLFVGEPEARKGLDVLFAAVAQLPEALRAATEVVIAGASGRYPVPAPPPAVRVRSTGYLPDAQLAALYAGAAALVYPSRYEGFGLPVLEAMAAGAPVIASDIPTLRETAGDAAEFVPPRDPVALARALERVLSDSSRSADLRARGAARAASRTWNATAQQTFESIARAVDQAGLKRPRSHPGART